MTLHRSLVRSLPALALLATGAPALAGDRPDGIFAVVDHRIATHVQATPASYDREARALEIGRTVAYGDSLTWYDGRSCAGWQAETGAGPDPVALDPQLADLLVPGALASQSVPLALSCDGAHFAAVVALDARVHVAFVPNGTMYVVLERVPTEDEVRTVQQALAGLGLYAGAVDGRMGGDTRAALAAYAASFGVAEPRVGVLSEALYQALATR